MIRASRILIVIAAPVLLAGCADYLNNRDTVSFGAGDAVAWNRAVQTERPWNPDSQETRIATDGEVVAAARRKLFLPTYSGSSMSSDAGSDIGAVPTAQ